MYGYIHPKTLIFMSIVFIYSVESIDKEETGVVKLLTGSVYINVCFLIPSKDTEGGRDISDLSHKVKSA